MNRKTVAIGMLGATLDKGEGPKRWEAWRPTLSLLSHDDLVVDRLELILQKRYARIADQIVEDAARLSPETEVRLHHVEVDDPWDFEEVYGALHDFADDYAFAPDGEDYLVHMTTGTHVAQICLYLLTEARFIPGRLVQTSPPNKRQPTSPGRYAIIDLDLSRYDKIASRFAERTRSDLHFLKAGIETRSARFNEVIEQIEKVALRSTSPILLTGRTGVGKSVLARRIYELKKRRRQVDGDLVEVNCATLRGDGAMSTLFGHAKGAFTGASTSRQGLLLAANGGLLFLDEIGELGLDEQAMLLRAIEEKRFLPMGSDKERASDFQLIAGTNRDLRVEVEKGRFREDLLARTNLWSFEMPSLRERPEDIEPNLDFETRLAQQQLGHRVAFNKEARRHFLDFALNAAWPGNFRDFHAAVERMATLSGGERITVDLVDEEIERLGRVWHKPNAADDRSALLDDVIGPEAAQALDLFDRVQLEEVIRICAASASLSAAGRTLFAASRSKKTSSNDADRLRKYLGRFGIVWRDVKSLSTS